MKNKRKLLLILALACCFTFATFLPDADFYFSSGSVAQAAAGSYYSSITATSGKELLGQLHDLMVDTHSYYSTYADCSNPTIIKKTDGGNASGTVMEFYTQQDMSSQWGSGKSGTWNREHVWPKSRSNGLWKNVSNSDRGAGADLHHIRPAESDLNTKRGNDLYGETSGGQPLYATGINGVVGGYSSGEVFEPTDSVKGDAARIVMYVYMHYNNSKNVSGTKDSEYTNGNLPITNIISAGGEANAWKLLLKWNKLDPVDDIERTRNDYVATKQGNRNPFIDNESYADAIWGDGTVETTELKSLAMNVNSLNLAVGGSAALSVTPTPSNANSQVTWTSSNTSVATVDANGNVKALAEGSAVITAASKENSSITATATVTVKAASEVGVKPFTSAVEAIDSATGLEGRFNAINAALQSYSMLSESEKQQASAAYQTLLSKIKDYNLEVQGSNDTFSSATALAAKTAAKTMLALLALAVILKQSAK